VAAGEPLLPFVDARPPWVEANFKETQLRRMRVGQKAEVEIDAIGGKKFDAVVESMTPGTGATFALIPPENATGNFTKIVQRVPVRLCFAPGARLRRFPNIGPAADLLAAVRESTWGTGPEDLPPGTSLNDLIPVVAGLWGIKPAP